MTCQKTSFIPCHCARFSLSLQKEELTMRKIFLTITVVLAGALTAFAQDDKDNHNTVEKCDTLTSTSVEKGNVYMSHYRPATSDSAQYKPKNYYIDSHAVTMPNHNAFSYKIKQDDRPVELLDWLGGLLKDILF